MFLGIPRENFQESHINPVAEAEKKLRAQFHYRQMGDDESHDSVICKLHDPSLPQTRMKTPLLVTHTVRIWGRCPDRSSGGWDKKTELPHGNSVEFAKLKPAMAGQPSPSAA